MLWLVPSLDQGTLTWNTPMEQSRFVPQKVRRVEGSNYRDSSLIESYLQVLVRVPIAQWEYLFLALEEPPLCRNDGENRG